MDFFKTTKIVFGRIYKIVPEFVFKIIGYIILNSNEHDMIRLAFCSDTVLQCVINKVKSDFGITEIPAAVAAPVPISDPYLQFFSPSSRLFLPHSYSDALLNCMRFLSLEDQFESVNHPVAMPGPGPEQHSSHCGGFYPRNSNRRCDFPVKVCHYFSKGYCKHGSKCRYFHGQVQNNNEQAEHVVLRGRPLEKLEIEIVELLKSRRGIPISIASLPMIYYEKYGRSLQADGYLTESQRHGKAGFSLTKLLANLKCICVLDRPHGQHSVILAEDAPKYIEFSENSARQIYLTFPAESTFTEQDVSNYFSKYGPVQDVRIPCQQSRMYGFVTFVYVETAKQILSTTASHFVCGAQVLVKPYKEKSRLSERKNIEKSPLPPVYYIQNYMEGDFEPQCSVPRVCDGSRFMMRKHLIDENEQQQQQQQQQQHSEFLLTSKNTSHLPYLGFSAKKWAHSSTANAEMKEFPLTEHFYEFLDSWTGHHDDSTGGVNLPDSPFASPIRI